MIIPFFGASYKGNNPIGSEPHPLTSFNFIFFLWSLVSKCSYTVGIGLSLIYVFWGGHKHQSTTLPHLEPYLSIFTSHWMFSICSGWKNILLPAWLAMLPALLTHFPNTHFWLLPAVAAVKGRGRQTVIIGYNSWNIFPLEQCYKMGTALAYQTIFIENSIQMFASFISGVAFGRLFPLYAALRSHY